MPSNRFPPVSRSAAMIKVCAATYLIVSTAIIIFGRNVPAIWQGMIGLIASLEGFYGAEAGDPRRVTFFLVLLFPCVILACTLGVLAVTGNNVLVNCNPVVVSTPTTNSTFSVDKFEQCNLSFKVYGYVELLGGAGIGTLCIFIVFFSLRKLRVEADENDAKQADMENLMSA